MSTPAYQELTSRNWGFIPPEVQKRLAQTKILLAGCGLGSNLARDLAAIGVTRFSVYDGDTVEYSNLGRQAYTVHQLGQNKAEATRDNIISVNPEADVEVNPFFIEGLDEIRVDVESADFILNTVDYKSSVFLTLTDYAQEMGKWVFFPTNIGWGAVLLHFTSGSISMAEYLGVPTGTVCDMTVFLRRLAVDYLPPHLEGLFQSLTEGGVGVWPSVPQVIAGAQLVSAMICTHLCAILAGQLVKVAPEFYAVDLWPGGEGPC